MLSVEETREPAFGLTLRVRRHVRAGRSSPVPWVLLHGFLDQSATWDGVASLLSQTAPVLAPDQRGFGCSDHVGPGGYYHFTDYVLDLDHLLRGLGLERVRLIGHSMGATVACMFTAMRPSVVESLHLIDGLGPAHMEPSAAVDQMQRHVESLQFPKQHRVLASVQDAAERIARSLPDMDPAEALRLAQRATRPQGEGVVWRWDPLHRSRAAVAFDGERFGAMLDRIDCPSQVVLSERGWVRTLPDMDERLRRLGAQVHRWPGGHNPHVEDPTALAGLLLDFDG